MSVSLILTSMSFILQKGHGIPDSFLKEVRGMAHQFFNLPYEEKLKIKLSAATGYRFVECNKFYDNVV